MVLDKQSGPTESSDETVRADGLPVSDSSTLDQNRKKTRQIVHADPEQLTDYQRERATWLAAVHAADESLEARPYLILLEGGIAGTPYRLEDRVQTLGRAPENQFQVIAAPVSRRHLRFAVGENRQAWVTDLGSSNGSVLNERRLPPKVTVPLRHGDQILIGGVIRLQFVWLSQADERDFLKRYERMTRDSLTGLHNRLYFQDQVESRIQRGLSKGLGLGIALMDLDGFKPFNDKYGHDVGDDVLRGVADLLRETAPNDCLTTRHGGEEFLMALSTQNFESAKFECERIRVQLANRNLQTRVGAIKVTASVGMAYASPSLPRKSTDLIALADRCLYMAKERGRNQVVAIEACGGDSSIFP